MVEAIAIITALLSIIFLISLPCKLFIKGNIGDKDER